MKINCEIQLPPNNSEIINARFTIRADDGSLIQVHHLVYRGFLEIDSPSAFSDQPAWGITPPEAAALLSTGMARIHGEFIGAGEGDEPMIFVRIPVADPSDGWSTLQVPLEELADAF